MDFLKERRLEQNTRPSDVRDEYDRDEARLIHSAAFRRLQSKTQVLGLGESDFYRTRLTHSMEVAQIGRGIVQYLAKTPEFEAFHNDLPNTSLITAICLAHDIGHPPFGHGGEVALNYCMREHGGFEGNGQTLRILGHLDKYTLEHGLNPTRRMLLGVLKYPLPYLKTC
ncbi:dGTP triphosphohydrolase [Pseudoalteromonas sp. GB56]